MVTVAAPLGERSASFGGLWRWGRPAGIAALILILCFLSLYPMVMLLYGSLHSTPPGIAGEFNLNGYISIATTENLVVLANTVGISLVKTVLALALAVLLAWIVARTDTPGRGVLEVLITLPFFIPPILTATAWAMLGNAQVGTINLAWRWLSGTDTTLVNVYSYGGVIWHMMQYSTPFIFLFVVDAFRAMDPALEESSRMSGATRWQTFWRVTLALMFLLLVLQSRLLRGRTFTTVTGKGYSPNIMRLGRLRWVTFGICILFFALTVALPIGQLMLSSFFKFFGFYEADMLTFDHYRSVWE